MDRPGLHVALIMDGNGRWAEARGRPRNRGHQAGARAVRGVVEAAAGRSIHTLTLYAFSSDNWRRPRAEVEALMQLLRRYLRRETPELVKQGIRLEVVGRRDRLQPALLKSVEEAETATARGDTLTLRLAVDYSSRDLVARAVARLAREAVSAIEPPDRDALARALGEAMHSRGPAGEVDLLIRTGGEQRLSDFLLWECAYAELVFTPCMWPDFDAEALDAALAEFEGRDRRFGRVAVAG